MANKKLMVFLVLALNILMPSDLPAKEPLLTDYIGLDPCKLPQGADITGLMPIRPEETFYLAILRLHDTNAFLLVQLDTLQRCERREIAISGVIRAIVLFEVKIGKIAFAELECRWKDKHNDDHLVGIVRGLPRPNTNPYVRSEQAWLVDLTKFRFLPVKASLVECFNGACDSDDGC